jgi:hypothetical protein
MKVLLFFLLVLWSVPVMPEAAPCDARSAVLKAMERLSPNNARLWLDMESADGRGRVQMRSMELEAEQEAGFRRLQIELTAPEALKGVRITARSENGDLPVAEVFMPATGRVQKMRIEQGSISLMGSELPVGTWFQEASTSLVYIDEGRTEWEGVKVRRIRVVHGSDLGWAYFYLREADGSLLYLERYNKEDKPTATAAFEAYPLANDAEERLWPAQIRLKNLSSGEQTLLVIRKGLWPIKS